MRLDDKAANFLFETCGVFPVEIELVNIQGKESAKLARFQQKFHPKTLGKTNKQSYILQNFLRFHSPAELPSRLSLRQGRGIGRFPKDPFFAPQPSNPRILSFNPTLWVFIVPSAPWYLLGMRGGRRCCWWNGCVRCSYNQMWGPSMQPLVAVRWKRSGVKLLTC